MFKFNTIEEALEDLRQGKVVLCTDDPDRENEGDFICAAEFATTENVNFMAVHGKGLICMPMSYGYVQKLQFPQMVTRNTDNHETAFTVSIDHVDTTTGISAAERALTARKCVDPDAKPQDFRRPGHMFPLLAKDNGVLERNGHTEATVDLMRLDNRLPNAATCRSLELGMIRCIDEIGEQVRRALGLSLTAAQIECVLRGDVSSLPDEAKSIIHAQADLYVQNLLSAITECGLDTRAMPAIFMGGGAALLKRRVSATNGLCRPVILDDVSLNAKGYERLVRQMSGSGAHA